MNQKKSRAEFRSMAKYLSFGHWDDDNELDKLKVFMDKWDVARKEIAAATAAAATAAAAAGVKSNGNRVPALVDVPPLIEGLLDKLVLDVFPCLDLKELLLLRRISWMWSRWIKVYCNKQVPILTCEKFYTDDSRYEMSIGPNRIMISDGDGAGSTEYCGKDKLCTLAIYFYTNFIKSSDGQMYFNEEERRVIQIKNRSSKEFCNGYLRLLEIDNENDRARYVCVLQGFALQISTFFDYLKRKHISSQFGVSIKRIAWCSVLIGFSVFIQPSLSNGCRRSDKMYGVDVTRFYAFPCSEVDYPQSSKSDSLLAAIELVDDESLKQFLQYQARFVTNNIMQTQRTNDEQIDPSAEIDPNTTIDANVESDVKAEIDADNTNNNTSQKPPIPK